MAPADRERIELQIQRIREVYPQGRHRCAWCQVRQPKHNFDCPAVDVHFLLSQLSALTEALAACQQERERDSAEILASHEREALLDANLGTVNRERVQLAEALTACQQERDRLRARTHEMQERHDKALVEERKHRDRAELDQYRSCFDEANKALIASDGGASKCGYVTESLWNRSVFLILRTRAEQAEAAFTACRAQGEAMRAALKELRIDANRLCDRNLGGSYEADCRRSIARADAALSSTPQGARTVNE